MQHELIFPSHGGALFQTAQEQQDATLLIQRLLQLSSSGRADMASGVVMLESLTGGRSAAHVFKLTPMLGSDRSVAGTPLVAKICPRAEGECEKANYDRYVRGHLPETGRPEMLGFVTAGAQSAICYTFVGCDRGPRPETLTDHLQRGDLDSVYLVLRNTVDLMGQAWYGLNNIRLEDDIAKRYLDRYFEGRQTAVEAEAALFDCAERYFGARREDDRWLVGEIDFPSPCNVLFKAGITFPYHSCILHGDLNTDNIIMGADDAFPKLIDFEKTGRGHAYEDLVALEASIRINYLPNVAAADILELERLIVFGRVQSDGNPYAAAIGAIRAVAFGYFADIEGTDAYHFAVAMIGLRLMQAIDLTEVARARITAGTLWAAKALECARHHPMAGT